MAHIHRTARRRRRQTALVWLAFSWASSEARCLTDAFSDAVAVCQKMFACTPLSTCQGFMWALVGYTPQLMPLLRALVQQCMPTLTSKFWRIDGFVLIAFDGRAAPTPEHAPTRPRFCAKNYGKSSTATYRKKKPKGNPPATEREKQGPSPGAASVDHPALAYGAAPAVDLAFGPVELQRKHARDGDAQDRELPAAHVVVWGCRLCRLTRCGPASWPRTWTFWYGSELT